MTKRVTVYVHGSDDVLWDVGIKLGLKGEALAMFSHACDEFRLELDVDLETGLARVVTVDGRTVSTEVG